MAVISFNFTKIDVERSTTPKGKLNVKNNVSITEVKEASLELGKAKENGLRFFFEYNSIYEPNIGHISLKGDLIVMDDAKKVKETMDSWNKDKKVPKEIMAEVVNTILARANIQSLIMSQTVNLPPPLPMPKVEVKK